MNLERLRLTMAMKTPEDRMFNFDPKTIDWDDYFTKIHIPGVLKYLCKWRLLLSTCLLLLHLLAIEKRLLFLIYGKRIPSRLLYLLYGPGDRLSRKENKTSRLIYIVVLEKLHIPLIVAKRVPVLGGSLSWAWVWSCNLFADMYVSVSMKKICNIYLQCQWNWRKN